MDLSGTRPYLSDNFADLSANSSSLPEGSLDLSGSFSDLSDNF